RLPEAGVGIHDRRKVGHARDLAGALGDLGEGGEADVGQAQVGRQYGAGDVDPLEPLLHDEFRGERVEGTGEPEDPVARKPFAQQLALGGGGDGRVEHQKSPSGTGTEAIRPGLATTLSPPSSSAPSSGSRCTRSRKRSISSSSSTCSARVRNLW